MKAPSLRDFRPPHIGMRIIKTAVAVFICLLVYYLRGYRGLAMPSEAALTAIVCMQPYVRDARDYAINRFASSLIGSAWGLLFLLLMLLVPALGRCLPLVYALMAVGVLLTLYTSVLVRMPDSSCLAAIVFVCVVISFPEIERPLFQAAQRITGVLLGTLAAVGVNVLRLPRRKNRDEVFFVRTAELMPDRFSQLPPAALFRLNRLVHDGAKLCLMSEHAPAFFTLQMHEALPSLPFIVMDGAAIFDPRENEMLDAVPLPPESAVWLREELKKLGLSYFLYTVHRRRTCVFHDGPMTEREQLVYERMRRSPYRSYLEGEVCSMEELVYLKLIDERDKLTVLEKRLRASLTAHGLRAAVRVQAGAPGLAGLYIYAREATMENAEARLMERLWREEPGLKPREITLGGPCRSEHDTMLLLHRLENAYEPLRLFGKKREGGGTELKVQSGRARLWTGGFLALVYLAMLLFFTLLHPIPVMDGDDMIIIIRPRPAIPIPGAWNPSRVLGETLMPLCGMAAGLLARLGLGSFIDCQIFVLAAMLGGFITLYAACFLRLLRRRVRLGSFASLCLTGLFVLLHFFVFRSQKAGNLHLFHSYDACCVFYYTIPALLCCALVLVLMAGDGPRLLRGGPWRAALLLTGLYFALFSNLFGSAVLAAWAAFTLLAALRRKKPLRALLRENALSVGIVAVWLLAALFELSGGRAGSLSGNAAHLPANLREAVASFAALLRSTSPLFRLLFAVSVPAAVAALWLRRSEAEQRRFARCWWGALFCLGCALLFHLLLSAAATPMYAGRPEAAFPLLFLCFTLMLLAAARLLRLFPRLAALLPLVLLVSFSLTNTAVRTFADSNPMGLNGHLVAAVENDICEQILTAAREGRDSVTVEVLRSRDDWANWPHNPSIGNAFAACFLKYGLIERPIEVTCVPSDAFNAKYGVEIP